MSGSDLRPEHMRPIQPALIRRWSPLTNHDSGLPEWVDDACHQLHITGTGHRHVTDASIEELLDAPNLQHLARRIESADELLGVTRSMRGLAAANLRHFELATQAVGSYEAVVEDGLKILLRHDGIDRLPLARPAPDARTALIVFGSNQGLCGSINRRVAGQAKHEADRIVSLAYVGAVGDRLAAELDLVALAPTASWDLPGLVEGITRRAVQVLDRARGWRHEDFSRILLVFPRFLGRHRAPEPVTLQLTPTDRDWLEWLAIRRWPISGDGYRSAQHRRTPRKPAQAAPTSPSYPYHRGTPRRHFRV